MTPDPATVCDEYGGMVRSLAARCRSRWGTANAVDADDVKQEMWVGVLTALARHEPRHGPVRQYVRFAVRTAGRVAIQGAVGHGMVRLGANDELTRLPPPVPIHSPRGSADALLAELIPEREPNDCPDPAIPDLWEQAARHLTPAEYRAVELHYRDGLGRRRMAAELGVAASTTHDRITKALAKLRAVLANEVTSGRHEDGS